ncbi:hypothetical protein GCM10011487_15680 [Steroidobacter agaridevorans]|uniref:Uncharacterized protein n=1 Tax=Steroidobacter agaridevorans TaxID=2695856 RepID=A0A829Y9N3_9GAMM|nr:hypothetical protein [Steroidobacter agaridevorans]GFE79568.1 hypothetical protein GCM10011487_15680 [Steroidobacter agaridevorans]GFE88573.1 hypothetical protein GCM10011488_35270 [Steroidobacter agaridevorans]
MARFNVYRGEEMIGGSDLEFGDPPMGVAFGRFIPNERYKGAGAASSGVLSVCTASGVLIEASGGVHLEDQSAELGPDGMEVSVLGIASPEYGTLFPEHVTAYEHRLKSS